jgi:drug/metabolite transporter (DMT)-like permease
VDPIALGCVALAAILHAGWNILLKAADDPLRTAAVGIAASSAVIVPVVVIAWLVLGQPSIPPLAWGIGILSGGLEVLYFAFLAAAFRRGDLSVVYPLARGSAPLLAIAIGITLLGERLSPGAWLGVGLLLAGLLFVQRPWRLLRSATSADDRSAAGFALLTGATIATYSALDTVGVSLTPVWVYAGILWPTCMVGLAVLVFARRRVAGGRFAPPETLLDRRSAVAGGFLTFSAYGLVLVALSRAPLAIVAPLRESAIVLTSLWGVVRLGEAPGRRERSIRIGGSLLVLVGAAVLAVAR